jgi:hypothetical protein
MRPLRSKYWLINNTWAPSTSPQSLLVQTLLILRRNWPLFSEILRQSTSLPQIERYSISAVRAFTQSSSQEKTTLRSLNAQATLYTLTILSLDGAPTGSSFSCMAALSTSALVSRKPSQRRVRRLSCCPCRQRQGRSSGGDVSSQISSSTLNRQRRSTAITSKRSV